MTREELKELINEMVAEEIALQSVNEGILSSLMNKFKNKTKNGKNLINKDGYIAYTSKYNIKEISKYSIEFSKSKAVKDCLSEYGSIDNDTLIIYKKNLSKLEKQTVFLYHYKIISQQENDNFYNVNILDMNEYNALKILQELNIQYEIKDTSNIESERKKIYNALIKIVKEVFKDAKQQGYKLNGWAAGYRESEPLENFLNGRDNEIEICTGDPWIFTNNNARDDIEFEKYAKVYDFIYTNINNRIEKSPLLKNGKIEDYGDWDDTIFTYILEK